MSPDPDDSLAHQQLHDRLQAMVDSLLRAAFPLAGCRADVLAALLILYFTDTATDDEHADMLIEVLLAAHAMGAPQGNA